MPTIPKLNWRHGKKSKSQAELPQLQSGSLGSLGSSQPSSSTIGSLNTLNSWDSHASLNSHRIAERERPLQRVPENAASYRIPAELEAQRRDTSWTAISAVQQADYVQQYEQHQRIAQEAQMRQVLVDNHLVADRKERADAEKRILERQRNASADNVRRLRELIRERYALDLYIWEKRNVQRANRKKILPKCKKADAILQEIYFIVNAWDDDLFDKEELQMVRRIKAGLSTKQQENGESGEPAIWSDLPPWDRRDETEPMGRAPAI